MALYSASGAPLPTASGCHRPHPFFCIQPPPTPILVARFRGLHLAGAHAARSPLYFGSPFGAVVSIGGLPRPPNPLYLPPPGADVTAPFVGSLCEVGCVGFYSPLPINGGGFATPRPPPSLQKVTMLYQTHVSRGHGREIFFYQYAAFGFPSPFGLNQPCWAVFYGASPPSPKTCRKNHAKNSEIP